jgi:hypothetical protein
MVLFLITEKAEVTKTNQKGETALSIALALCDKPTAAVLFPVYCAAAANNILNALDSEGSTPMHLAAAHKEVAMVLLLIENKADVTKTNKNGDTALSIAVAGGDEPITAALLLVDALKLGEGNNPSRVAKAAQTVSEGNNVEPLYLAAVELARLRLALAKQHELMQQYTPKLAAEGLVFLSDFYDCPELELEALLGKVEMKGPHAKLIRGALKAPQPAYSNELADFVKRPEQPPDDFLVACGLSKFAKHLMSDGYDIVRYLLDATETELAVVCAAMKPVERRRFLRAAKNLQFEARAAKVPSPAKVAPFQTWCTLLVVWSQP